MVFITEWKNILTQRYAELRKAENRIKDALYPRPRTAGEPDLRARKKDGLLCGPRLVLVHDRKKNHQFGTVNRVTTYLIPPHLVPKLARETGWSGES